MTHAIPITRRKPATIVSPKLYVSRSGALFLTLLIALPSGSLAYLT